MVSYGLILLVQIACMIHAGRTGRPYFWFMIILFVPGLGILAYLAVEVIPGLLRGRTAARLSRTVSVGLDPTRQYREFARAVETLPSVANLRALADECVRLGRHDEAIDLYKSALTGMHETEPYAMLGLAMAEFRKGDADAAGATLDRLFAATRLSTPPKPIYSRRAFSKPRIACRRRSALTSGSPRLIPARRQRAGWRYCFRGPVPSSGRARSSPRSANRSNAAPRFIAGRSGNGTRSRVAMHELHPK
jgi:hypothetical protein